MTGIVWVGAIFQQEGDEIGPVVFYRPFQCRDGDLFVLQVQEDARVGGLVVIVEGGCIQVHTTVPDDLRNDLAAVARLQRGDEGTFKVMRAGEAVSRPVRSERTSRGQTFNWMLLASQWICEGEMF